MAVTLETVLEQVEALSPEDRRKLWEYLQEELEEAEDIRISDERLADLKSGRVRPTPADEFWADLEREGWDRDLPD